MLHGMRDMYGAMKMPVNDKSCILRVDPLGGGILKSPVRKGGKIR